MVTWFLSLSRFIIRVFKIEMIHNHGHNEFDSRLCKSFANTHSFTTSKRTEAERFACLIRFWCLKEFTVVIKSFRDKSVRGMPLFRIVMNVIIVDKELVICSNVNTTNFYVPIKVLDGRNWNWWFEPQCLIKTASEILKVLSQVYVEFVDQRFTSQSIEYLFNFLSKSFFAVRILVQLTEKVRNRRFECSHSS